MKLAKIAKICKQNASVEILNETVEKEEGVTTWNEEDVENGLVRLSGTQWIGDGAAFYKLSGMPRIENEEQWFKQYDVPMKKKDVFFFQQREMPDAFDWDDYTKEEKTADVFGVTIGVMDHVLQGVYATEDAEVQLVNTQYLEPIDDMAHAEITIRHMENGQAYICIREKMELIAVILPMRFGNTVRSTNTESELQRLLWVIQEQIREAKRDAE
ncbi:MAG: hypothetical protein ACI4PM_00975 [Butyricicoccus sp.]